MAKDALEHALPDLGALPDPVALHARLRELLLRLLEPPDAGAGGDAGEQEEPGDGDGEADDSVDDEDPAPGRTGGVRCDFLVMKAAFDEGGGTYHPAMPSLPSRP